MYITLASLVFLPDLTEPKVAVKVTNQIIKTSLKLEVFQPLPMLIYYKLCTGIKVQKKINVTLPIIVVVAFDIEARGESMCYLFLPLVLCDIPRVNYIKHVKLAFYFPP